MLNLRDKYRYDLDNQRNEFERMKKEEKIMDM